MRINSSSRGQMLQLNARLLHGLQEQESEQENQILICKYALI